MNPIAVGPESSDPDRRSGGVLRKLSGEAQRKGRKTRAFDARLGLLHRQGPGSVAEGTVGFDPVDPPARQPIGRRRLQRSAENGAAMENDPPDLEPGRTLRFRN